MVFHYGRELGAKGRGWVGGDGGRIGSSLALKIFWASFWTKHSVKLGDVSEGSCG